VLSYVVAGVVSALAALCYAELSGMVPVAGSAYTYSYATLGEFVAWIIGWDLILEYSVGAAAVAIGWSGYVVDFFTSSLGWRLPHALTTSPFSGGVINLPAALSILVISALLIKGTRETSWVNNFIVAIKLTVILFFIVVGVEHVRAANWHPFLPFGIHGVFTGASIIFFAYIGFDMIATSAEEARNHRDLPRAILVSLAVCTVLYILVSGILTGMLRYTHLNNASPVAHAMIQVGLSWAGTIVALGAIAGLTTVLLVDLYSQSRVFFSMSRDGLLPGVFSRIHPNFRTPFITSGLIGLVVAVVAGLTPIDVVVELVNIGTLAAFILVAAGVVVLRRQAADADRPFRVPFVPILPAISILASVVLIVSLPLVTILRFVVWLVIGLVVYFTFSRRHSRLQRIAEMRRRAS
jgi:APA family basic amino acid/polyamine antiporter